MKKVYIILLIIWSISVASRQVFASGFAIFEQSTHGASLGGAFVATADDASALWYNPAGISQLAGTHVMVGTIGYYGKTDINFDNRGTAETTGSVTPVPHLFCTRQISDIIWAGVGFFAPYGLSTEFDEDWDGRYNGYYAGSVCLEMNPNIAFKITDKLSVGVGFSMQRFEVEMKQKVDPEEAFVKGAVSQGMSETEAYLLSGLLGLDSAIDANQKVTVKDTASFRYNFSTLFRVNETLSFGLSYRSKVDHKLSGKALYQNIPTGLSDAIYDADVKGTLTLPDLLWIGVAYHVSPEFTIEVDFLRTGWSSYKTLLYDIGNEIGEVTMDKNWKDVNSYRLGLEYDFSNSLALRFGYLYDESSIPKNTIDYGIPSDDRHVISTGLGYSTGKWTIDTMYCRVLLVDKRRIETRPDEGIIYGATIEKANVHQLGLSVAYEF